MLRNFFLSYILIYVLSTVSALPSDNAVGFAGPILEEVIPPSISPLDCIQPDYFRCPQVYGRFPHPKDCTRYYWCINDCPFERKCDFPLKYNSVTNACDNISSELCVKPPKPLKGDIFEGVDSRFICPRDGVFPHQYFCEKYISCMNAVPYVYACKEKLYDIRYKSCNLPELTPCQERKRPNEAPPTMTPPTYPEFECPPHDIPNWYRYHQDPFDCRSYFICQNGYEIAHATCNDSLYFDEDKQVCNYRYLVQCKTDML